jgi:hypothetical protein
MITSQKLYADGRVESMIGRGQEPSLSRQSYNTCMLGAERVGVSGLCVFAVLTGVHGSLCGQAKSPATHPNDDVASVLFVGCKSVGQVGPIDAPSGRNKTMTIPTEAARRLAYYKAKEGVGVLAPKGWHCFGAYGSNGTTLYVSPDPISPADVVSSSWKKGLVGPVVQISLDDGGTSGRFAVARTIARVFPARKDFVENVIAEGIEPASSFPFGPYPLDALTYRGENVVEFSTPARAEGLGTDSRLQKNDTPIRGAALLVGEEPNLLRVWVRLPSEDNKLSQLIIQQTEREAARLGN